MPEHEQNDDLNAPDEFVQALRRATEGRVNVPGELEEQILDHARKHLQGASVTLTETEGQPDKIIPFPGNWIRLSATAAVLALMGVVWVQMERRDATPEVATEGPTIVDALLLARELNDGEAVSSEYDLNGDGVVDELDVDLLAHAAVALPEGGSM